VRCDPNWLGAAARASGKLERQNERRDGERQRGRHRKRTFTQMRARTNTHKHTPITGRIGSLKK
jgi:hypothetical protein